MFVDYSQGFRVPTPVELTCADPGAPCALPIAFVADPPLAPGVVKSWEVGVRGRLADRLRWSAAAFRSDSTDDIVFTAVGAGRGLLANVPRTRRQGIELGVSARGAHRGWFDSYAFVDARFGSDAELFNPAASEADPTQPGTIEVEEGDRLPGIPRQRLNDKRYAALGALNRNAFDADSEPLQGIGPGPGAAFRCARRSAQRVGRRRVAPVTRGALWRRVRTRIDCGLSRGVVKMRSVGARADRSGLRG